MANSYLCSFDELFMLTDVEESLEIKQVVIPIIQRDYAQGRKNEEVKKIRDRFLNSLFNAVNGDGICLDFIYGDIDKNCRLTPLDGQQRLTTLFLLYWYSAKKANLDSSEYLFLRNFTYETRYSSRDFCRELIDFSPVFNVVDALSDQIINQSWFPLDWKNDPTISSMLVMIDELNKVFENVSDLWEKLNAGKKIKFYFLPIKNMGLTDELYIKMNSRGKPLTPFEHFKAEFERQIGTISKDKSKEIESKIDLNWTDFLWNYRNDDGLTDTLFLNYFKYICDVICYEEKHSPQNRSYDDFDLINEYFGASNSNREKHLLFLEKAFDCWNQFGSNLKVDLFDKFVSIRSEDNKSKLVNINNTDLLKDCLTSYYDNYSERRSRSFTFAKFILLYAFMQYALNKPLITDSQMSERIRIVNNLISNSNDEMNDSENRVGGNRLPSILEQTKSIIINGRIVDNISINFNSTQLEEEKAKIAWRLNHPTQIYSLNKLEDHDLLNGQISVVGLENDVLFDRFTELFTCNKDKISCALLTFGDYSRVERNWRYSFGATDSQSWKMIFHQSSAARFDETKNCLVQLLSSSTTFNNQVLDGLINNYITNCETNLLFEWRYYFVKYSVFRPNRYGKYYIKTDSKYCMFALWTPQQMSQNAFQPYLKAIDAAHLDRDNLGQRLLKNNQYLYCEKDKFVLKDLAGTVINTLQISQDSNHIDTEDRIAKYLSSPLV
ncbi:MAG: DUF262 domain-containing protein [Bacteroidales bacterium]|nr:DUF262 domain-containing protein [Bacteroidales bacterium]